MKVGVTEADASVNKHSSSLWKSEKVPDDPFEAGG